MRHFQERLIGLTSKGLSYRIKTGLIFLLSSPGHLKTTYERREQSGTHLYNFQQR